MVKQLDYRDQWADRAASMNPFAMVEMSHLKEINRGPVRLVIQLSLPLGMAYFYKRPHQSQNRFLLFFKQLRYGFHSQVKLPGGSTETHKTILFIKSYCAFILGIHDDRHYPQFTGDARRSAQGIQ
jgi:hypothetical protein